MTKQELKQTDISNLRFYARMAQEHQWETEGIHHSVIVQTLNEIADRLAARSSGEPPLPRWIRQEDQNGCVVAAIAMIVGRPYAEIKAELRPKDLSTEAYTTFDAESYLYEHGYSLLKKWKHVCFKEHDRETWPVAPFALLHYVQVVNGPTGKAHDVVMLANGDVLDPWADAAPKKLTDYYQVNEIIGVFSPSDPSGRAGQEPKPLPCRTPGAIYHFKLAQQAESNRQILTLHVYIPQEIAISEEQAESIEVKLHAACEGILAVYWPDSFMPRAEQEELALARMVLKFWGSHEAFGDFASLTSCAGAFAPIADAAREIIEKCEPEGRAESAAEQELRHQQKVLKRLP